MKKDEGQLKQMIVTKEYAVSHLQRHELYHDAFLLQIRFVDCHFFLHTFDFRKKLTHELSPRFDTTLDNAWEKAPSERRQMEHWTWD